MKDHFHNRCDKLAHWAAKKAVHGILVTSSVNISYLTGFSGGTGCLLVGPGASILVTDGRFSQQLDEESPGLDTYIHPLGTELVPETAKQIARLGWTDVAIESAHISVDNFESLKEHNKTARWKPTKKAVENLRICKDDEEIRQIREAISINERAFGRWKASLKDEDTEKQLAHRMEMMLREEGAASSCFPTIVGINERAALPHAPLSDKSIAEAELVLVDWGADGGPYKSDLTRVLSRGTISDRFAEIYEIVLAAQQAAIDYIRPGRIGREVDAVARRVIQDAGYGDQFTHSLGHGLGMEVHEKPGLRRESEDKLAPGMVITVEPGIYIPDWGGIRIEDDVLVTQNGCEVLSAVPKRIEETIFQ